MLLIIEALFISAALLQGQGAATARKIFLLDMALNSVDDEYDGYTVKMANLVETKYLPKEINNSADFKKAWQEGELNATTPEGNLTKNHSIALYVYTNMNSTVYSNLNMAVRNGKQNYTDQTFKWYSLHFLLTDAIQKLIKTQKKCKSTYRGTTAEFYKNATGKEIRFGSFTSSSLERKVAEGFGNKSCFEIKTCEGADVIKYSKYPEQKEVLIPPYEMFNVTAVRTRTDHEDLWCDTVFTLESSGKKSYLNCSVAFKKPIMFTKNNSTFCRCFSRKLRITNQTISHSSNQFIGQQFGCLKRRQPVIDQQNNKNREINLGRRNGEKQHCFEFLKSKGIDPTTSAFLKPCCRRILSKRLQNVC